MPIPRRSITGQTTMITEIAGDRVACESTGLPIVTSSAGVMVLLQIAFRFQVHFEAIRTPRSLVTRLLRHLQCDNGVLRSGDFHMNETVD